MSPEFDPGAPTSRGPRRRTCYPLAAECLEARTLLAGGLEPTAFEQLYLEELNDARFDPAAYGASLGGRLDRDIASFGFDPTQVGVTPSAPVDLSAIAPAQPLAMNAELVQAARLHSQDMLARDYFSNISPDGLSAGKRMKAAGFHVVAEREPIESLSITPPAGMSPAAFAATDTEYSLAQLIADATSPDLDHRVILLDIGGKLHSLRQVGIGIASQDGTESVMGQPEPLQTTDTTITLASSSKNERPFLTGVAFDDQAGNGEYEPGEGLGGVAIAVSGGPRTTTMDAGGYSIPLKPGTYTVTASGGGLASPIVRTVVIGKDNVRLNFDADPNGATLRAAPGQPASGIVGSFRPFSPQDTAADYAALIDWGNGVATDATLAPDAAGGFDVVGTSGPYASGGVYAVRALVTRLSNGQTLALNGTVDVGQ